VITSLKYLSSFKNNKINTNDETFALKQFSRKYPGNYNINFVDCLADINSIDTKNYTNFYLTNKYKISDVFLQSELRKTVSYVYGPILSGGLYLKFNNIDPRPYSKINKFGEHLNYGVGTFSSTDDSSTKFTIEILKNNNCRIFHTKNYKRFFLCSDIDNNLVFIKEKLLSFDENSINPQDFEYIFSEDQNNMFFYKRTIEGNYNINDFNGGIILTKTIENDIISNTKTRFKIFNSIYNDDQKVPNVSYITYNGDNTIDTNKSDFNLDNNILLHKTYSNNESYINYIFLKNQLMQTDIFSSANNLLSGENFNIYVNGLREYSSILSNIPEENSESLNLNYVYYNKPYTITPGSNIFEAPASMYPFSQLNINDTKFVSSGAFSYMTPEYSDKIYHISNDIKNKNYDQHLLCTWLSGSPNSSDKVWVDRYYYPDYIEKQQALSNDSELSSTYNDHIENMISLNSDISSSVQFKKFFDKKSDLVFIPNEKYNYSRINVDTLSSVSSLIPNITLTDINYFNDINSNGELSIGFVFDGDDSTWVVESDRNEINSGLSISKTGNTLTITYDVYDSTSFEYDLTEFSWIRHSKSIELQQYKSNFVCVGINTKNNESYFFVNGVIIHTFKLPVYQIYIKHLLYGDFFVYSENNKIRFMESSFNKISKIFVSSNYIPMQLANIVLLQNISNIIDNITISLPCGMRNSEDSISLLNSVCSNSTFTSNYINLNIKNLNIDNPDILNSLAFSIKTDIESFLPTKTIINDVKFNNYKQ
jgi:hypothetical protein